MAKTIEEIKKRKIELESEITKMFKEFEKDGVKVTYINIERIRKEIDQKSPRSLDYPYEYEDKGIRTINLEISFKD